MEIVTKIAPIVLALIMLGLGLGLSIIIERPRPNPNMIRAKTIGAILVTISILSNHTRLYLKDIKIFFYVHEHYFHIFVANALK